MILDLYTFDRDIIDLLILFLAYSGTSGNLFLRYKMRHLMSSIISVRMGKKHSSLAITVCHHEACRMITNGDRE